MPGGEGDEGSDVALLETEAHAPGSDEALLLDYRDRGNRLAFEELVHRYQKELLGYLRNYLGDPEMAEDAAQQTWLQVFLKCDQFDFSRKFRPWLYAVATNQGIDLQRKLLRHRMASLDRRRGEDGGEEHDTGALGEIFHDPSVLEPNVIMQMAERNQQVLEAVDSLPEQLRQVVLLVYFQGVKYREAALAIGIPIGTVKSRLHTALQKLGVDIVTTPLTSARKIPPRASSSAQVSVA
jgi:RNA polymerase sigma-70 factor (ECF subfamily)